MDQLLMPVSALSSPKPPVIAATSTSIRPCQLLQVIRGANFRPNWYVVHDLLSRVSYVSPTRQPLIERLGVKLGGFSKAVHGERLYKNRYHVGIYLYTDVPNVVKRYNSDTVTLLGDPACYSIVCQK